MCQVKPQSEFISKARPNTNGKNYYAHVTLTGKGDAVPGSEARLFSWLVIVFARAHESLTLHL